MKKHAFDDHWSICGRDYWNGKNAAKTKAATTCGLCHRIWDSQDREAKKQATQGDI